MGPLGVVVLTEVFDHDPGLGEGPELLAVEAFIAEAGVERFDEAVLPRACRGDVEGLDFLLCEPALEFLGDELRSVVGADELGRAVQCDGCLNLRQTFKWRLPLSSRPKTGSPSSKAAIWGSVLTTRS